MQKLEELVQFDRLENRLLRSGIAPRHVRGLMSELRNHFDDAVRSEVAKGLDPASAERAAWQRLGSEDSVVQSALAQPQLRALAARFPKLIFGGGPFLLWIGAIFLTVAAIVGSFDILRALDIVTPGAHPEPPWLYGPAIAVIFFYSRILPVAIGAAMLIAAVRQRLSLRWPMAGAVLISLFAGSTDITIKFSTHVGEPGELSIGNSLITVLAPITEALGIFKPEMFLRGIGLGLVNIAIVFAAYWLWQRYARLKAI